EALDCVQVVQFGAESGYLRVNIEGDALLVLRKLQEDLDDRSEIRAYILNVKHLKGNFINCKFKYASRTRNNVAHTLAKEGLRVKDFNEKEEHYVGIEGDSTSKANSRNNEVSGSKRPINGIGSVKRTWSWLGCPEKQSSK
ncbi:hypothetical protein Goarm_021299, partial [Gossypium armourianum]|nr:hypothetical protein [Gossypium armourianum]